MDTFYEDDYIRIEYDATTESLDFVNMEDTHASTGIDGNELIRTLAHWLLKMTDNAEDV